MRQRRRARAVRRARRIIGLLVLAAVVLVTLLLTAFGNSRPRAAPRPQPAPAVRLLPAGPPQPQVIAMQGSLPIQMPVPQSRVTAIGYHGAGDGALPFHPLGHKANAGFFSRLGHRLFGGGSGKLRYFQLSGGQGPGTTSLDVGAPAGTTVYSPVDGSVVAIDDFVLNGRRYGAQIEIQPTRAPSVVVAVSRLRPERGLSVGSSVSAGVDKLGRLLDLSGVEQQALSHYTQDAGNHVAIEVHEAPTTGLP